METTKKLKEIIETKSKELEDLKKRLPSSRDKRYGTIQHNDPVSLWEKVEELENQIERLRALSGKRASENKEVENGL